MTTKISPYRTGAPRFGNKDSGPINSEVVTYQLPPAELEAYRKKGGFKLLTKEDYLKRKDEGKTDKEIMEEFNCNHNRMNSLKKQWGLIGAFRGKQVLDEKPEINPVPVEKPNIIIEFEQKLKAANEMAKELQSEKEKLQEKLKQTNLKLSEKKEELNNLTIGFDELVLRNADLSEMLARSSQPVNERESTMVARITEEVELLREENAELRNHFYAMKKVIKILA